jgi:hypothetical protein
MKWIHGLRMCAQGFIKIWIHDDPRWILDCANSAKGAPKPWIHR